MIQFPLAEPASDEGTYLTFILAISLLPFLSEK